ncbi:phytase [Pseudoxanthomonas koreensis]|uniref:phytase n=1 Tax=Pseudoxanthomonas koreensis TaxID=266061 RepID=UPI001390BDB2|nr:phytase [Pseudoxanthomonas koreensis]KAF1696639.1 phytase [Pseudoxanthomonas koreensis]
MPRLPPFLRGPCARALSCAAGLALAATAAAAPPALPVVPETWISAPMPGEELDSLAIWTAADGRPWLLATAKKGERLLLFDGDSGVRIGSSGGPGIGPGQYRRPNGVAVSGDLLFVVERDGRRVQVLRLPGFAAVGEFGAGELQLPYGIWLDTSADGAVTAYVTDSFMADFATATLPPTERLAERVKRYRVAVDADGQLQVEYLGAFGDTGEAGALRMVESLAGDPAHGQLLVADEDKRTGSTLREYSLDGRFLGRSLPTFEDDAEGVALWDCGPGAGYWIAADQTDPTHFRLFERSTLTPAGGFSGRRTALTDGGALHGAATPRFRRGVLFALHADNAVAAFDLGRVARRLQLAPACR